jgi:rubredoxin
MQKWRCTVCDYVYDPRDGDPDSGIEPGTLFEDLPDDWVCPVCGAGKTVSNRTLKRRKRLALIQSLP